MSVFLSQLKNFLIEFQNIIAISLDCLKKIKPGSVSISIGNINLNISCSKYSLEIFETNDEINDLRINSSNKNNNNITDLLNKYFNYLQNKGINNTFLPIILGIFKIKINYFNSLIVIIIDNSIVENVPMKYFTNWQLIRFKEKNLEKVASSRYKRNTILDDDKIFKKF